MNRILQAAEKYAREHNWPVLPLEGKAPVGGSGGYKDGTTDIAEIQAWWDAHPDRNVGVVTGKPSGIVVLDVDGPEGERALLELLGGSPPSTLEARTPHGRHLYYLYPSDGARITRTIRLRPKLDVLGDRGYVVAPPSRDRETGAAYEWTETNTIAPLPTPILSALEKREELEPFRIPEHIEEGVRNRTLFRLGASMANKGCSRNAILAALRAENSERCDPPLTQDEVGRIAGSAAKLPVTDPIGDPRFRLLSDEELLTLPDPDWLIQKYLPAGGLIVLYGKPASGKSFLALDWAMHIATGRSWLEFDVRRGQVLYVVAEGGTSFKSRVRAWHKAFPNVRPPTGAFFLLEPVDLIDQKQVAVLVEETIAAMTVPPALVIFDTLARSMARGDENKQQDMSAAIAGVDYVRRETGAAVLLAHHTRRADTEERGSSVLRGAADAMFQITKEAGALTLNCSKMKDAELTPNTYLKLAPAHGSCVVVLDGARSLTMRERILSFVTQHPGCQTTEIRNVVGGRKETVGRQLTELNETGFVEDRGSQNRHEWWLTEVD